MLIFSWYSTIEYIFPFFIEHILYYKLLKQHTARKFLHCLSDFFVKQWPNIMNYNLFMHSCHLSFFTIESFSSNQLRWWSPFSKTSDILLVPKLSYLFSQHSVTTLILIYVARLRWPRISSHYLLLLLVLFWMIWTAGIAPTPTPY